MKSFKKFSIHVALLFGVISCVEVRYPDDKEWEATDIEQRILNGRRNDCALNENVRNDGMCIIWSND